VALLLNRCCWLLAHTHEEEGEGTKGSHTEVLKEQHSMTCCQGRQLSSPYIVALLLLCFLAAGAVLMHALPQEEKEDKLSCSYMEVLGEQHSMDTLPKDAVIIHFMDASSDTRAAVPTLKATDVAELYVKGQVGPSSDLRCGLMPI